jgi:hypothetical protein
MDRTEIIQSRYTVFGTTRKGLKLYLLCYKLPGLVGPLIGKNVTDLDNILKNKNGYVTVRTLDHQRGEIQGQILPTSSTINCLTTMRFAPPTTMPSPTHTLLTRQNSLVTTIQTSNKPALPSLLNIPLYLSGIMVLVIGWNGMNELMLK